MLFRDDNVQTGGPVRIPLLPLKDIVVFPHMVVPLLVGRQRSLNALEEATQKQTLIFLSSQKDAKTKEPSEEGIYKIGTLGTVVQTLKLPDGAVKVLIEGKKRAQVARFVNNPDFFLVEVEEVSEVVERNAKVEALTREVRSTFKNYVQLKKKIPVETVKSVSSIDDPAQLSDTIVAHLGIKLGDRQNLLETFNAAERLKKILAHMRAEIEILEMERRIRSRAKKQKERPQKEYYLSEQMRAIQKVLGKSHQSKKETQGIKEKVKQKKLSAKDKIKVRKVLTQQLIMTPQLQQEIKVLQRSRIELEERVDKIGTLDWQEYLDTHSSSMHGSLTAKAGLLEDHLLWQLRLSKFTEPESSIGLYIIQNLDKNGYLALKIEEVCAATKSTPAAVEAVLKRIQFFDPVGVAARDLRECLLAQLENLQLTDSLAAVIVRNHLSLLESKRYERLAKDLNVSIEKIANAAHLIGSLEAKPSRGFEQDE